MRHLLLLALAACSVPKVVPPEEDTDTDTDIGADTDTDPGPTCDASFTLTLPDASTTTLGCTEAAAEATFEMDPDTAPAVRSLGLRFSGGADATANCQLALDLDGICGPGWYALGVGASGSVVTLDCTGVDDAMEDTYQLTSGSVYLAEISAGDEAGEPARVELVAAGTLSATSAEGLSITGSFRVVDTLDAVDVEGGVCLGTDTDPGLVDLDLDGWEGDTGTGEDCDDADATVYPGAYDRPDDGIDGDCDGVDRSFDGVVLAPGETADTALSYEVVGAKGLDIALLLDTTCSMGAFIAGLDVYAIADAATGEGDARWSFSGFDDYAFGGFGAAGTDKPFYLRAQLTDDLDYVQAGVDSASTHSGADAPEAGMEAIYQALTGAGYDQDCDGTYDSTTDVYPFLESATDPFGGWGGSHYDNGVSGSGTGGGVGFRDDGQPVVVIITDNYLRDPDSTDPAVNQSPGGCPGDAGADAVVAAARARGAWIIGIAADSSFPIAQLTDLTTAAGSLVDNDGDGAFDDVPVYWATETTLNANIASALDEVAAAAYASAPYDEVTIVVGLDPYGLVSEIVPATFSDVIPGDLLPFDLRLVGIETTTVIATTIELWVYGDGVRIGTIAVAVEIAPG
ncbi:MAG: MopE-related protein [Myxococcota bacterium]